MSGDPAALGSEYWSASPRVGHFPITAAHDHAPAATLAPLSYLGIVSAAVLGHLLFGDWPDLLV